MFKTPEEAVEFIHSLYRKAVPGLERSTCLLNLLGNPQKGLKFVHVAGTNGKGSTAAMTASILQKAGYSTGLFTSPFLYRFHERIQLDGQQIADEDLVPIIELCKSLIPQMPEPPTEFEFVTALAFEYYKRKKADIVVLEVGLGGAIDPTNMIECPEVAVITNIGLDHTEILGDTVEKIAANKAGIFKNGCHAVVYRGAPSVEKVFEDMAAEKNVTLHKADFASLKRISHSLEGQVFDCGHRKGLTTPLLGEHQLFNTSVVLSVCDALKAQGWVISEENIRDGIAETTWPGRFEIMHKDPLFIIDAGHNPQCMEALVKNIQEYLADRKVIVLAGVLKDKDFGEMFRPVLPHVDTFVCMTPPSPRKLPAEELAAHLRQEGANAVACPHIPNAVAQAIELAGKEGVVLSFGSLYTICDVRDGLLEYLNR